jgi:hypothetical protein
MLGGIVLMCILTTACNIVFMMSMQISEKTDIIWLIILAWCRWLLSKYESPFISCLYRVQHELFSETVGFCSFPGWGTTEADWSYLLYWVQLKNSAGMFILPFYSWNSLLFQVVYATDCHPKKLPASSTMKYYAVWCVFFVPKPPTSRCKKNVMKFNIYLFVCVTL